MHGIIYLREFPNGKVYIGQTIQKAERRWQQQNYDAKNEKNKSTKLSNALRKYDYQTKDIILYSFNSKKDLNLAESIIINMYNSRKSGYNIKAGGDSSSQPEEVRKKIGLAQMGEKNHNWGKSPSKKTREIWSTQRSGKNNSIYGTKRPEDVKEKIRKGRINYTGQNSSNYGKGCFSFAGVFYDKRVFPERKIKPCGFNKGWISKIKWKNKVKILGYFSDPISGVIFYKISRKELDRELKEIYYE